MYYCVLLLYVVDDDGSDIKEEFDNGKINIMEIGGKVMYYMFYMYLWIFYLGYFEYYNLKDFKG